VVPDVCGPCNSGPLGTLDGAAKDYWDAGMDGQEETELGVALAMARWACKVAYNAQRAVILYGAPGAEPPFPSSVREWVLRGGTPPTDIAVAVARMPPGHRDTKNAAVFSSNGTELPRRYVQMRGSVWFVAWDPPGHPQIAEMIAREDSRRLPAVILGRTVAGPTVAVPLLRDPDVVWRGFWNNRKLLRELAERYPPST